MFCMRRAWYIVGTALVFLILRTPTLALTINPARITVTIARGEDQVLALTVRNDGVEAKKYQLGVLGAKQDLTGRPVFKVGTSVAEAWVASEKNTLTILQGKTEMVYFIVKVPATAAPGSVHFIGLTVAESADNSAASVSLAAQLISLVEIRVAGIIQEHGVINFWHEQQKLFSGLHWPFEVSLTNLGTGSAPLKATVRLESLLTRRMFDLPIDLGSPILPGTSRQSTVLLVPPDILVPGIYLAKLQVAYGYTAQILSKTTFIVYLPQYAQLIGALILCGAIFLGMYLIKRFKMNGKKSF